MLLILLGKQHITCSTFELRHCPSLFHADNDVIKAFLSFRHSFVFSSLSSLCLSLSSHLFADVPICVATKSSKWKSQHKKWHHKMHSPHFYIYFFYSSLFLSTISVMSANKHYRRSRRMGRRKRRRRKKNEWEKSSFRFLSLIEIV